MNTCSATSRICEIKGGQGILRYRGYPIEQLAERSTFTEVSFLLIYGQLPDAEQLKYFNTRVMRHTFVHEDLKKVSKKHSRAAAVVANRDAELRLMRVGRS